MSWSGSRGNGWAWSNVKRQILDRDRRQCQVCGQPATEVDHILNRAAGGTDDPTNLRAICNPCHTAKTRQEQRAGRKTSKRTPEQHPGIRQAQTATAPALPPPLRRLPVSSAVRCL